MAEPTAFLRAVLRHRMPGFELDAQIALSHSWTWLFGPSGAGKTTLLRMLCGLERPQAGSIILGREQLTDTLRNFQKPTCERGIGLVMQEPLLFPHWTVAQNLLFAMEQTSRTSGKEMTGAFDERGKLDVLMERFRIGHIAKKKPVEISGGEKQRVALARAVAAPAMLLLLDEPLTGLDATLREELMTTLRSLLARRGTPVLAVTHDVGEVFSIPGEVMTMEEGRIVEQGPAKIVLAKQREQLLQKLRGDEA